MSSIKKWRDEDQYSLWNVLVPKLLQLGEVPELGGADIVSRALSKV